MKVEDILTAGQSPAAGARLEGLARPNTKISPAKAVTVMLVEDHAIMRRALRGLLSEARRFLVVGEARNGREAVEMARTLRPDIILMDIAMPLLNGLEATRQILAADPGARVIVLSAYGCGAHIEGLIRAGVVGILEKQRCSGILIEVIREVARGGRFFSPAIVKRLTDDLGKSEGRVSRHE
jgi:DNA-binding NarL/FixJ family response regulator